MLSNRACGGGREITKKRYAHTYNREEGEGREVGRKIVEREETESGRRTMDMVLTGL